jgi:hypothetical protein
MCCRAGTLSDEVKMIFYIYSTSFNFDLFE